MQPASSETIATPIDARGLGRRGTTLLVASLAFFVILLDNSIVNLALVRLQQALRTDLGGLQWVVDVYALVFASLLLTGGTLADKYGASRLYLLGIALFTAASALCGLAPTLGWLLAGRTLQGIGGALLLPASLTLLRTAYPGTRERAHAVGIWIGAGGLANAIGPSLGGLVITFFSWRAIFLINLPIGLTLIWLTQTRVPRVHGNQGLHLDWVGQSLVVVALGAATWSIIEGPNLGWHSPLVLCAMVLAGAGAAGFVLAETRSAQPMLPFSLFRGNAALSIAFIGALHNVGIYGQLFVAGLFLQRILAQSPLAAGLMLLPMTASIAICAFLSGRWISRAGPFIPMNVGHTLAAAGALGMVGAAIFWQAAPPALTVVCLTAVGMGAGLASPPMTAALLTALPQDRSGLAGGVLNMSRQVGNVLGIAVLGAVITGFGGLSSPAGFPIAWLLAALALGTNVVLGVAVARHPSGVQGR